MVLNLNSLSFCLAGKLLVSPHQIGVLLGRAFLAVGSSLSLLYMYHAVPFWLVELLVRNRLIA